VHPASDSSAALEDKSALNVDKGCKLTDKAFFIHRQTDARAQRRLSLKSKEQQ